MKLDRRRQRGPAAKLTSFKPTAEASNGKWVKSADGRKHGQGKWKNFEVDRGSSLAYRKEFLASRKAAYISENYKRKNPMTRSQWRREQRTRKTQREVEAKENVESRTNVPSRKKEKEDLRLVKRKLITQAEAAKEKYDRAIAKDKMLTNDFDFGSEPSLDVIVNVVSVLPR